MGIMHEEEEVEEEQARWHVLVSCDIYIYSRGSGVFHRFIYEDENPWTYVYIYNVEDRMYRFTISSLLKTHCCAFTLWNTTHTWIPLNGSCFCHRISYVCSAQLLCVWRESIDWKLHQGWRKWHTFVMMTIKLRHTSIYVFFVLLYTHFCKPGFSTVASACTGVETRHHRDRECAWVYMTAWWQWHSDTVYRYRYDDCCCCCCWWWWWWCCCVVSCEPHTLIYRYKRLFQHDGFSLFAALLRALNSQRH